MLVPGQSKVRPRSADVTYVARLILPRTSPPCPYVANAHMWQIPWNSGRILFQNIFDGSQKRFEISTSTFKHENGAYSCSFFGGHGACLRWKRWYVSSRINAAGCACVISLKHVVTALCCLYHCSCWWESMYGRAKHPRLSSSRWGVVYTFSGDKICQFRRWTRPRWPNRLDCTNKWGIWDNIRRPWYVYVTSLLHQRLLLLLSKIKHLALYLDGILDIAF